MSPILFLDFDGVLHSDHVYCIGQRVVLRSNGALFDHVPVLEEIVAPYPALKIVLRTSWCRVFSFDKAKAQLCAGIQERVIGSTFHRHMNRVKWDYHLTRFQQIKRYVDRLHVQNWIAIDNDCTEWPDSWRHNLALTDDMLDLGQMKVQQELRTKLAIMLRNART